MLIDIMNQQIKIIPAIDLLDGQVVRLHQGDYNKKKVYYNNCLSLFDNYINQGANYLHLVDLSGAKNPKNRQINLISKVIQKSKAKIQVGGGIRTKEDIQSLLDIGANRVVIGSSAIDSPSKVKDWFSLFGSEKFVLSLDVNIDKNNNKNIAINAWQDKTNKTLENVIDDFSKSGLKYVLCTDIARDGTMLGSNVNLYKDICQKYPNISFQASGGINSLEDIVLLKNTHVEGIIIGKALLDGKFTIREALSNVI